VVIDCGDGQQACRRAHRGRGNTYIQKGALMTDRYCDPQTGGRPQETRSLRGTAVLQFEPFNGLAADVHQDLYGGGAGRIAFRPGDDLPAPAVVTAEHARRLVARHAGAQAGPVAEALAFPGLDLRVVTFRDDGSVEVAGCRKGLVRFRHRTECPTDEGWGPPTRTSFVFRLRGGRAAEVAVGSLGDGAAVGQLLRELSRRWPDYLRVEQVLGLPALAGRPDNVVLALRALGPPPSGVPEGLYHFLGAHNGFTELFRAAWGPAGWTG
jgi:hypothetical protein